MVFKIEDYLSFSIKLILILSILNSAYFGLWHIMSTNIFLLALVFSPQILKKSYNLKFPKEFEILLLVFIITTGQLTSMELRQKMERSVWRLPLTALTNWSFGLISILILIMLPLLPKPLIILDQILM